MNSRAQAGLEYLLTYGWAIVLIAAVLGVLVFIVGSPASGISFSSSDPMKILLKAGTVSGTNAEIKLQNITGASIEVTNTTTTDGFSTASCTLNGEPISSSSSIFVTAGSEMHIECSNVTGNGSGTIEIEYTDYAGLQRSIVITASGEGGSGMAGLPQKYEYYNSGDDGAGFVKTSEWPAQTFTPAVAHKIMSVKLKLYRVGSPGTIVVGIRATDGSGHPTGSDLCSGSTDGDTLPEGSPYEWREITLGAGCSLSASTKYAIVVRTLSGDWSNFVWWREDFSTPSYLGGSYEHSSDFGSTWNTLDRDLMFEEWGIPPPSCDGYSYGGYCWYKGGPGQSCDDVCASHGGCVDDNWNDTSCAVLWHFESTCETGDSCWAEASNYAPHINQNQWCYFRDGATPQSCSATAALWIARICACAN